MKSDLLISVVMPVYNGERYLKEAIDSIRNQSYTNWELIAVDDGSSDSSLAILNDYAAQDARIKVIQNERNVGLPAALNVGLKNATGDWIARHDADDISEVNRFQAQTDFLQKNPNIGLVGCNGWFLNDNGERQGECNVPTDHAAIVDSILTGGFAFMHGSWMFRRVCMNQVGRYNEMMFACEDKDLWLRISEQFTAANLPDRLYQYRMHDQAFTVRAISRSRYYRKLHMDLYYQRQHSAVDILTTPKGGFFDPSAIPHDVVQSLTNVAKANTYVGSNNLASLLKYSGKALYSGWNSAYIWKSLYHIHFFFFQTNIKYLIWHLKTPTRKASLK